jgi:hypothetical protein
VRVHAIEKTISCHGNERCAPEPNAEKCVNDRSRDEQPTREFSHVQSLSVLFLFEAFLTSMLAEVYEQESLKWRNCAPSRSAHHL